jgi:nucleoid-associated protein YejK
MPTTQSTRLFSKVMLQGYSYNEELADAEETYKYIRRPAGSGEFVSVALETGLVGALVNLRLILVAKI